MTSWQSSTKQKKMDFQLSTKMEKEKPKLECLKNDFKVNFKVNFWRLISWSINWVHISPKIKKSYQYQLSIISMVRLPTLFSKSKCLRHPPPSNMFSFMTNIAETTTSKLCLKMYPRNWSIEKNHQKKRTDCMKSGRKKISNAASLNVMRRTSFLFTRNPLLLREYKIKKEKFIWKMWGLVRYPSDLY